MSVAAIAWIILGVAVLLVALAVFFMNIPELKRYLNINKM